MRKELAALVGKSTKRKFKAGNGILYQGEAPRLACVIVKGIVRVYSISPKGDELNVMFHVAGEFFPSSWIFGKAPNALFFYEAKTDCEIAYIPRQELISFMTANPQRFHALLDYFTTNYAAFMIRVNALEQPKARDKLIYTLYFLCQRYADNIDFDSSQKVIIPLHLTHQNIAGLVGLTRETTAIELNNLKNEGVLKYRRQRYVVDISRLFDLIGDEGLQDVSIAHD